MTSKLDIGLAAARTAATLAGEARRWYRGGQAPRPQQQIRYIERRVRRLENRRGEWKTHSTANSGQPIDSTGYLTPISNIAQGSTGGTREGLLIYLQSIKMNMKVQSDIANDNGQNVRVILFFDTQQHGTYPTAADKVLEATGANYSMTSVRKVDTKGRFQFIFDQILTMEPSIAGKYVFNFGSYYKRFKNGRRIYYIGNDASEAAQGKGTLFLLLISDQATNYPVARWTIQLKFTDM